MFLVAHIFEPCEYDLTNLAGTVDLALLICLHTFSSSQKLHGEGFPILIS